MIDNLGLITSARRDVAEHVRPFVREDPSHEGQGILEVVRRVSRGVEGDLGV